MTTISDAYDAIVTRVNTSLPNHVEVINPYQIDINDDLTLEQGYGIEFGPGTNNDVEFDCRYRVARDIIITITRKMFKGDLARNTGSVAERRETEKNLFEDLATLVKDISKDVTLQNAGNNLNIHKFVYVTDNGLEFVRAGQNNFIMVRAIFNLEYVEVIT